MQRLLLIILLTTFTPRILGEYEHQVFQLRIYTSVEPIASLISYLGDFIKTKAMIPSWANPHDYDPKPKDIAKLINADLYVLVGLNFEPTWIERAIKSSGNKPTIFLANLLKDVDISNPHIWLSLRNAIDILQTVKDSLKRFIPAEYEKKLETNFQIVKKRIEYIDSLYTKKFNSLEDRKFASLHRAWGYLARDYNLEEIETLRLEHEHSPGPRKVKKFIEGIKSNRVRVIFADRFVPQDFIDLIRRETNCKVLMLDPIGSNKPPLEYIEFMKWNLDLIYRAFLNGVNKHGKPENYRD